MTIIKNYSSRPTSALAPVNPWVFLNTLDGGHQNFSKLLTYELISHLVISSDLKYKFFMCF